MAYEEQCAECNRVERNFIRPREERMIRFWEQRLSDADADRLDREEDLALVRLKDHFITHIM